MQDQEIEQTLTKLSNVYAYKLPPTLNIDNFNCEQWPKEWQIFNGSAKVVSTSKTCSIVLINDDTQQEAGKFQVQFRGSLPVIGQAADSSRYFALVISDPTGQRQAFVGLGFKDRDQAFDFKVCLNDFGKFLTKQNQPQNQEPVQDFSLKEGQKIKISLGKKRASGSGDKAVTQFNLKMD